MLSLTINNIKDFMSVLLRSDQFDHFLLKEATIVTNVSTHLDGRIPEGFYTKEDLAELSLNESEYIPYGMIKNTCFELIKGKRTPVSFKFVFLLSHDHTEKIKENAGINFDPSAVTNMCFICSFSGGKLTVTDGISYQTFVPNHDLDKALDNFLKNYLNTLNISFEETI
ncbi:MAG: DUF5721 family protein [Lachnospiraceae bacterium]|nr:DUF5721 family protein [Lachnospiraceae bacterium]